MTTKQLLIGLSLLLTAGFGPYYALDFDPERLDGISPTDMQQLLDQGLSIEYTFPDSSSLLMQAAARSSGDVVKVILTRGAAPNRQDRIGNAAIIYAAMYNLDTTVLAALASASALPNLPDFEGATALFYAAGNNPNPDTTTSLLAIGAAPNHSDQQGLTPLIMAATTTLNSDQRDTAIVVQNLLNAGAYPTTTYNGLNAYDYAIRNPNLLNTKVPELLFNALNAITF